MANVYAIGDVQGCFDSLEALVARLPLQNGDRIWLCGDLVNRGPKSLEVLRWAKGREEQVQVVLGNHDLHLLSAAAGARKPKARDTMDDILAATDRDELLEWLCRQPLVHSAEEHLMVHAGLHPAWDQATALAMAGECEAALRDGSWLSAWKRSRPTPPRWSEALSGTARIAAALSVFVGVRTITADGELDVGFAGPPHGAHAGFSPWFAFSQCEATVVFGHWASLGLHVAPKHIGLDTGCVWGGSLTAIRLRDRAVFQQPSLEAIG